MFKSPPCALTACPKLWLLQLQPYALAQFLILPRERLPWLVRGRIRSLHDRRLTLRSLDITVRPSVCGMELHFIGATLAPHSTSKKPQAPKTKLGEL